MSKTKIIFHGSQQFIEKDADDIQNHNFQYTDANAKVLTKNAAGEHVTTASHQTGVQSFLPQAPDYTQSPVIHTVRFSEFSFYDTLGNLYVLPDAQDFVLTTDLQAVNDYFLANGGNPNFPDVSILNNAIPRFSLWIEPVLQDVAAENRNFINVNTQESRNVFTRQQHIYNVRISQNSPGAGYFDVGTINFIFDPGRTVPAISSLNYTRDILSESAGFYTNASNTRNRRGVIPRLSQRLGDAYDTVLRAGNLDNQVDGFTQDRQNLPRLSISGLEARQSVFENNTRMAFSGVQPHLNTPAMPSATKRRGPISKIGQVNINFSGDTFVNENVWRTVAAHFDPVNNFCYIPALSQISVASSMQGNPAASINGFGNTTKTGNSEAILFMHKAPLNPFFFLRLDDDFHEKYTINHVKFSIQRRVSGGLATDESCPAVLQFFSASTGAEIFTTEDNATTDGFVKRTSLSNLFALEAANVVPDESKGLRNELTEPAADTLWQGRAGNANQYNFLQINTSLIMPNVQFEMKRAAFRHNQANIIAAHLYGYEQAFLETISAFDNLDQNGVTLPVYAFPDFVLHVELYGYSKHYDAAGVQQGDTAITFKQHSEVGL